MAADRGATGRDYGLWYGKNDVLRPDIIIPDFDYSLGVFARSPGLQGSARHAHEIKAGHGLVRLVLSREPIGGTLYREILECDHKYVGIVIVVPVIFCQFNRPIENARIRLLRCDTSLRAAPFELQGSFGAAFFKSPANDY